MKPMSRCDSSDLLWAEASVESDLDLKQGLRRRRRRRRSTFEPRFGPNSVALEIGLIRLSTISDDFAIYSSECKVVPIRG